MKLSIYTHQANNLFHVEISLPTYGLTPVEAEAVAKLGEPVIECGGEFSTEGLDFELDSNERYFPSQFPVKQIFSGQDYENAYDRAILWKNIMKDRIQEAITELRFTTIHSTGQEIVDIDTTPTP